MFLLPKSSDSESGTDSEPAWVPSRLFLTFTKKKTHAAASTRHSGVWSTCSQSRAILKISPKQRRTAGLKQRDSEESHTEM